VGLGVLSLGGGSWAAVRASLHVPRSCSLPPGASPVAALTIPSALTLLVIIFPDPDEQARAIGIFGACGAVGNGALPPPLPPVLLPFCHGVGPRAVLGLLIGGFFVEWTSWRWLYWFVVLVALPVAGAVAVLVPPALRAPHGLKARARQVILRPAAPMHPIGFIHGKQRSSLIYGCDPSALVVLPPQT
jgi:MFS family permease